MKRFLALFLAAALSTSMLTACGSREEPPASSEGSDHTSGSAAQTESSHADEEHIPLCGDGTLDGVWTWMETEHPDALAAAAYIGRVEGYTGGGPLIQETASVGYCPYVEDIPFENIIAVNLWEGDVFCITPRPGCTIRVETADRVPEILYESEYSDPVLVINAAGDTPDLRVIVTRKDGEEALWEPVVLWNDSVPELDLPEGEIADATFVPGESEPAFWQFCGLWSEPSGEVLLSLEAGGAAYYELKEVRDGRLVTGSLYEGMWELGEDGRLELQLGPTIWNEDETGIETSCFWSIDPTDGALILENEGGEVQIFGNITRRTEFPNSIPGELTMQIYDTAGQVYEEINGHAPGTALIAGVMQSGILVRLYEETDDGDGLYSTAWYIIDPGFMTVYDYMTGEILSEGFQEQEFTVTEEDMHRAEEIALRYYQMSHDNIPGVVLAENVETDGILVHLYDDMGTHTATYAWYVVNPDTLLGYDYMTGMPIDFSVIK